MHTDPENIRMLQIMNIKIIKKDTKTKPGETIFTDGLVFMPFIKNLLNRFFFLEKKDNQCYDILCIFNKCNDFNVHFGRNIT